MDGAMGKDNDVVEAVLTCEGDFHDPQLSTRIETFKERLKDLLLTEKKKLTVKKVEPWNSVKVTLDIPREAAERLRQLAEAGNNALRGMGVLSVQLQGDSQISLTFAGRNNEPTQVMLRTPSVVGGGTGPSTSAGSSSLATEAMQTSSDEVGSSPPNPSNEEVTRKNIVDYLRQGPQLSQNVGIFDAVLGSGASASSSGVPRVPSSSNFNPIFRPNNLASLVPALQSQKPKGSQLNSNLFPFSKAPGAFQPLQPSASAGQSIAASQQMQKLTGSPFLATDFVSQSIALASAGMTQNNHQVAPYAGNISANHNTNVAAHHSTSNVTALHNSSNISTGAFNIPPASIGVHSNPISSLGPLSTSTPNFVMNLPPPPPYPHAPPPVGPKQGRQPSSSSPLLVNLLQTDPSSMAVVQTSTMMSAGHAGTTISASNSIQCPSPMKKKRKHKKDGIAKTQQGNFVTGLNDKSSLNDFMDQSKLALSCEERLGQTGKEPFSVNLMQSKMGVPFNPLAGSLVPNMHIDHKLFDCPTSTGIKPDSGFRSAIGSGKMNTFSATAESMDASNSSEGDSFNMETAGKIINPFTGELEPRDGMPERTHKSVKSPNDNFAMNFLAKKAQELISEGERNNKNLPVSSNSMISRSITGVVSSPSVATSERVDFSDVQNRLLSSVPPHRRNLISDGSHIDWNDSSRSNKPNALPSNSWQSVGSNSLPSSKVPHSSSGPHERPRHLERPFHPFPSRLPHAPDHVTVNGPIPQAAILRHSISLQPQLKPVHFSPGSVIQSNTTTLSSSITSTPPHSHQSLQPSKDSSVNTSSHQLGPGSKHSVLPSFKPSGLSPPADPQRIDPLRIDSKHLLSIKQNQAANSDVIVSDSKTSSYLLNSLPVKDSQREQSPLNIKHSIEGDDNSNHSVTNNDALTESSGTAALLDHTGVKSENHDSGIGSSSERSDDTPSESGDGEFRGGCTEGDDGGKLSTAQKAGGDKLDSAASNTITVGYMVNQGDSIVASRLSTLETSRSGKLQGTSTSQDSLRDVKSLQPPSASSSQTVNSVAWPNNGDSKSHMAKHNGPLMADLAMKMNGPTSNSNIDKMIMEMQELERMKNPGMLSKALEDLPLDPMKLTPEVLDKMVSLHQDIGDPQMEESDLSIFDDLDEMINGKIKPSDNGEAKGSNITSMYSKLDTSPVNVNMLNHIYAPGLPSSRRLTESIQRLVKPLSETSQPQGRACKSPGASTSPRGPGSTTTASVSRVSHLSGARSPGASIPRLIPSDRHSLLSGGLDLAGLPFPPSYNRSMSHGEGNPLFNSIDSMTSSTDLLLKNQQLISARGSSLSSMASVCDGGQTLASLHSSKMLSKSFPPHKSRDSMSSSGHLNNELLASLHQQYVNLDRKSSPPQLANNFPFKHGNEPVKNNQELRSVMASLIHNLQSTSHNSLLSETPHSDSNSSKSSRLTENSNTTDLLVHSSCNNNIGASDSQPLDSKLRDRTPSTHSSASSPVMPILQKGFESPLTQPILPLSLTSSQPPFPSAGAKAEISHSLGSMPHLTPPHASSPQVTTHNVPYSPSSLHSSSAADHQTSNVINTMFGGRLALQTTLAARSTPSSIHPISSSSTSTPSSLHNNPTPRLTPSTSPRSLLSQNRNIFDSVTESMALLKPQTTFNSTHNHSGIDGFPQQTSQHNYSDKKSSFSNGSNNSSNQWKMTLGNSSSDTKTNISTAVEPPKSESFSTEVVNLDFHLSQMPSLDSVSTKSNANTALKPTLGKAPPLLESNLPSCDSSTSSSSSSTQPPMLFTADLIKEARALNQGQSDKAVSRTTLPMQGRKPFTYNPSLSKEPILEKLAFSSNQFPVKESKSSSNPSPVKELKTYSSNPSQVKELKTYSSVSNNSSTNPSQAKELKTYSNPSQVKELKTYSSHSSPAKEHKTFPSNPSSIKEPILETMASTLKTSINNSKTECSKGSDNLVQGDVQKEGKTPDIVTMNSKKSELNKPNISTLEGTLDSESSASLTKRLTRKRKTTGDSKESDSDSYDNAPINKHQRLSNSLSANHNSTPADHVTNKTTSIEKSNISIESEDKKFPHLNTQLNKLKFTSVSSSHNKEHNKLNEKSIPNTDRHSEVDKDESRPHRSIRPNKEDKEVNQKLNSLSSSLIKGLSKERKDSSHQNQSTAEDKTLHKTREDGKSGIKHPINLEKIGSKHLNLDKGKHRANLDKSGKHPANPEKAGLKHVTPEKAGLKPVNPERAGLKQVNPEKAGLKPVNPDKVGLKHFKPDRANLETSKEKSNKSVSQDSSSKDGAKKVKEPIEENSLLPAGPASLDDTDSKKGQRSKRQFYTYVPEKLIDKTYFDTPVLTNRTRSRKKPGEEEPSDQTKEGNPAELPSTPSTAAVATPITSTTSDKTAMEIDSEKRSTRSLRVKENPTDASASKRKRGNPQR